MYNSRIPAKTRVNSSYSTEKRMAAVMKKDTSSMFILCYY